MAKLSTPRDVVIASGLRPFRRMPDPKCVVGRPFSLNVTIANGSATNVDLTTKSIWATCPEIAAAWALGSGDSTKLDAVLHVDAVGLQIVADDLAMTAANKAKLLAQATAPYLSGTVNSMAWSHSLVGRIMEPVDQLELNFASAAAAQHGLIRGGIKPINAPIRIDLFNDTFTLVSPADVGLGATLATRLLIEGIIFPRSMGVRSAHPGASCGVDVSGIDDDADASAQEVAGLRTTEVANISTATRY